MIEPLKGYLLSFYPLVGLWSESHLVYLQNTQKDAHAQM